MLQPRGSPQRQCLCPVQQVHIHYKTTSLHLSITYPSLLIPPPSLSSPSLPSLSTLSLHSLSPSLPSLPPLSPSFPPSVPLHLSSLPPLSEQECADAYKAFNGRWYAMRQLSCQFCPVVKWKTAICGQSGHGRGRGRVHDQARERVHDRARESDSAGRVCRDSVIKGRYSLVCRDD